MACALTQNILLPCRDSVGGIKTLYVCELANVTGVTTSGGTVTAISVVNFPTTQFRQYNFIKETGSFTEAWTASSTNGTLFYAPTIDIVLWQMQTNTRNELTLLGQNELVCIVLDNNGIYWITGLANGLLMEKSSGETGKGFGDLNGYKISLVGAEPNPAFTISSALVAGII